MTSWKRTARIKARLRRWHEAVCRIFRDWFSPHERALSVRLARTRRVFLRLEVLEGRVVPTYAFLSSINYSATEGQGPVAIGVKLDSPSSQTVTVDYNTADQSAKAGTDYTSTSGQVTFTPGTTQQTVNVPILDDNQTGETSPEVFQFILSGAVNAIVGTPNMASVQIQEDNDGSSSSPIVVPAPSDQNNVENANVSLQIQASGGSGSLSYTASNLPSGLTINANTGLISGTISSTAAEQQNGQYPVTVTVYDSTGATGGTTFNWNVTPNATSLTLGNPGDQSNLEGDPVSLQLSASGPGNTSVTYGATGLPSGLTVNSTTGLISGTLPSGDAASSPYAVTVSATQGSNTVYQSFNWTVGRVFIIPVSDPSNLIGDSVSLPVVAQGNNGQALSYSATGLPPGLTINPTTGLISGTISNTASVTTPYNVTVTATDGTAPTSTSFAWTIANFVYNNPGDQTNNEGDAVSLQPTVESNGDSLVFTATGLPPGLSINSSGDITGTIAVGASQNSPYMVTVTASDEQSTQSQTFTWTVGALITLTNPGPQNNAVGDSVELSAAGSDAAGAALTYTAMNLPPGLSIDPNTGDITGIITNTANTSSPYAVTVTASDGTHSASESFNWAVTHIFLANPGDQQNATGDAVLIPLSANDSDGDTLSLTATGLPPGLSIDSNGNITGTISSTAGAGSPYAVTVTASDGTNSQSQTFNWTVSRILVTNPGDQTNADGDVVSLPIAATDNSGDTLTYSAVGLPGGLTIDPSKGIISGTIAANADANGPYVVTVTATGGGASSSQTFNWTVTNPLTLGDPGYQTNATGDTVSLQLTATDAKNGTLNYTATGLPPGLSINQTTGLISGTIGSTADSNSPYSVTVTATDGTYSASQTFGWGVAHLLLSNPGDQSNAVGDTVSLQLAATDNAGDTLTYSANGLPAGLSINPSTGLISGTISPYASVSSQYAVSVAVTDGTHIAVQNFNWNVSEIYVAPLNDVNNFAGDAVSIPVTAEDNFGQPINYTATGLPAGVGINATTGLISGTVSPTATLGLYTVTVTAAAGGYSAAQTFDWDISALALITPANQVNVTGDQVSVAVASNAPAGTNLTFTATGLPSGLSISNAGVISGVIAPGANSSTPYTVIVTADDGNGATSSTTFNWTVSNLVLVNPGDQTYALGQQVSLPVTAVDNGSGAITYTATGLPASLVIDPATGVINGTISQSATQGTYAVQVQAQDPQGNTATVNFNMNVQATTITMPNLIKVGLSKDPKRPLKTEFKWAVTPGANAGNITFEVTGQKRVTVDGVKVLPDGIVQVTLYGVSATPSNAIGESDTILKAIDKTTNKEIAHTSVSVIIPASIKTPHYVPSNLPTAPGAWDIIRPYNNGLNDKTSPVILNNPGNKLVLATVYMALVDMTVQDQFGNPLDLNVYRGAPVSEKIQGVWVYMNQTVQANSQYLDPVGTTIFLKHAVKNPSGGPDLEENTYADPDSKEVRAWRNSNQYLPLKESFDETKRGFLVQVFGFDLKPFTRHLILRPLATGTRLLAAELRLEDLTEP